MIVGQTTTRLPVDNTLSFVCQATSDWALHIAGNRLWKCPPTPDRRRQTTRPGVFSQPRERHRSAGTIHGQWISNSATVPQQADTCAYRHKCI